MVKKITLSKQAWRSVLSNVRGKEKGYSWEEIDRLDDVTKFIKGKIKDYILAIENATQENRNKVKPLIADTNKNREVILKENSLLEERVDEINKQLGGMRISLSFENVDFDFIQNILKEGRYLGVEEAVKLVREIKEGFDTAKEIKPDDTDNEK